MNYSWILFSFSFLFLSESGLKEDNLSTLDSLANLENLFISWMMQSIKVDDSYSGKALTSSFFSLSLVNRTATSHLFL